MRVRVTLGFVLALLLTASLGIAATAATEAQTAPAVPAAGITAPTCAAAGFLSFIPAPQPMTDNCGACSDALCFGRPVGSACGSSTTGVCVSTISCTASQKTCRCITPTP